MTAVRVAERARRGGRRRKQMLTRRCWLSGSRRVALNTWRQDARRLHVAPACAHARDTQTSAFPAHPSGVECLPRSLTRRSGRGDCSAIFSSCNAMRALRDLEEEDASDMNLRHRLGARQTSLVRMVIFAPLRTDFESTTETLVVSNVSAGPVALLSRSPPGQPRPRHYLREAFVWRTHAQHA